MYHVFFLHSFVIEHFGCCHVLAIVNSAAMNIRVHVSRNEIGSFIEMWVDLQSVIQAE